MSISNRLPARYGHDNGWLLHKGSWRPCAVVSNDDHGIKVRLADGPVHAAGQLTFLWTRPTDSSMPVSES